MKLLLTSNGITNETIKKKLREMVGKDFSDLNAVFIPTAMNKEPYDKGWYVKNLNDVYNLGFKDFDIVDISAVDKSIWLPKLEKANIIFCNGGSNYYLNKWIKLSGLAAELPKLLETKVWVGSSSGGMVMSPYQSIIISQEIYEEDFQETEDVKSLGYVDFLIIPHLNGAEFSKITEENIRKVLKDFKEKIYCIDDDTGVAVVDGKVELVTEGKYFVMN